MPNPVTAVPATPLPIDANVNAAAEAFLTSLLQIFEHGTTGLSGQENTDPSYQQLDGAGTIGPMVLRSREQQLFFRQVGLALAKNFANLTVTVPEPYFSQSYTSDGVTRGDAVVMTSEGHVGPGSCTTDVGSLLVGMARDDASAGATVVVVLFGSFFDVLVGAALNEEFFLGPTGRPVRFDDLVPGQRIIRLGYASSSTDLEVRIDDLGVR